MSLELLLGVVFLLLTVWTKLEVELANSAVSLVGLSLAVDLNSDILGGAVVGDSEGDPLVLHAAHESEASSVPSEVAILEVKHGRSGTSALGSFMLDLEEGEWSLGIRWDENLTGESGNIVARVSILVAECDLSARIHTVGIGAVRQIIGVSPELVDTSLELVVLGSFILIVALDTARVAVPCDNSLAASTVLEASLGETNAGEHS